jgi:hypothetical protein
MLELLSLLDEKKNFDEKVHRYFVKELRHIILKYDLGFIGIYGKSWVGFSTEEIREKVERFDKEEKFKAYKEICCNNFYDNEEFEEEIRESEKHLDVDKISGEIEKILMIINKLDYFRQYDEEIALIIVTDKEDYFLYS